MGTSISSRFHLSSEAKRPFGKELAHDCQLDVFFSVLD